MRVEEVKKMMEPCPITKEVCLLRPGGFQLELCKSCPEVKKFLELTNIEEIFLTKEENFIAWLQDEAYKNAPEGSFLERCYELVINNLEEVL